MDLTDQRIHDFVSAPATQETIRSTLAALVKIPSVSTGGAPPYVFGPESAAALDRMLDIGRQHGFTVENHDYYCGSVVMAGENCGDEIGIIAHLDVVPAVEGWRYPRYALTVENGLYIGRGVRDDKGPAVAALAAMLFFQQNGIRLPFTVRLLLGCDEERGMHDLPHYLETHRAPRFSFSPDSVFPVCIGEKGIAEVDLDLGALDGGLLSLRGGNVTNSVADRAEAAFAADMRAAVEALALPEGFACELRDGLPILTAVGKSAHAAEPDGSVNAIALLARFILASSLLPDGCRSHGALSYLCASLADHYGTGLDIAAEDAATGRLTCICGLAFMKDGALHVDLNIRYPASLAFTPLYERLSANAAARGYAAALVSDSAGYVFSPDKPEIAALTAAFSAVTGSDAAPYTMGGGTYARAFPSTVAFGAAFSEKETALGEGRGGAHERDECVRIEEFNRAVEIFIRALYNLAET